INNSVVAGRDVDQSSHYDNHSRVYDSFNTDNSRHSVDISDDHSYHSNIDDSFNRDHHDINDSFNNEHHDLLDLDVKADHLLNLGDIH
ncbi:MAG TPA: hypothetical protein VF788_02675, partial [Pseudonocardiaceae bacterium]